MVNTYELYFDQDGMRCFEPMLAASVNDLMDKVRAFIAERDIQSVEVCFQNTHLLTISAQP